MEKAIGIDFGYDTTRVAYCSEHSGGKYAIVEILENELGNRSTPTVIAFDKHSILIGKDATHYATINPDEVMDGLKRLIGRKLNDIVLCEQLQRSSVCFENEHKKVIFCNSSQRFTATELLAIFFERIKDFTEKQLGNELKTVVISVPSYFTHNQRQAVIEAANIAGFGNQRLVNDSTANALTFVWDKLDCSEKRKIMIIDFGGSSLDVALIDVNGGVIKVISTAGTTSLGGVDFDNRLIDFCLMRLKNKNNVDIGANTRMLHALRSQCEKAKITLQSKMETRIKIDFSGKALQVSISLLDFEDICKDLFEKAFKFVINAITESGLTKNEIDDVILLGGSSRLIKFETDLQGLFDGRNKKKLNKSPNVNDSVAKGAALLAAKISNIKDRKISRLEVNEINPYHIWLKEVESISETNQQLFPILIIRSALLPASITQIITLFFKANGESIVDILISDEVNDSKDYDCQLTLKLKLKSKQKGGICVKFEMMIDENGVYKIAMFEVPTYRCIDVVEMHKCLSENEIKEIKAKLKKERFEIETNEMRVKLNYKCEVNFREVKKLIKELKQVTGTTNVELDEQIRLFDNFIAVNNNAPLNDIISKSSELEQFAKEVKRLLEREESKKSHNSSTTKLTQTNTSKTSTNSRLRSGSITQSSDSKCSRDLQPQNSISDSTFEEKYHRNDYKKYPTMLNKETNTEVFIGIDNGSANCRYTSITNGSFQKDWRTSDTSYEFASCVAFTNCSIEVGDEAMKYISVDPQNTIYGIKILLGKNINDYLAIRHKQQLPFMIDTASGEIKIIVNSNNASKSFSPVDITTMILGEVVSSLEWEEYQTNINTIAITVPTNFASSQRQAIYKSAITAGFQDVRLINDTTAAALAYYWCNLHNSDTSTTRKNIMVVSIGSVFTNVSVIKVEFGSVSVIYNSPGVEIGGNDFDQQLLHHVKSEARNQYYSKVDLIELLKECETAKIILSTCEMTAIYEKPRNSSNVSQITVTRNLFETLCKDIFEEIYNCIEKSLSDSWISYAEIDFVVLVGETTRIPKIVEYFKHNFKISQISIFDGGFLSHGAALFAADIGNKSVKEMMFKEVTTFNYRIESLNCKEIVVHANTVIPVKCETALFAQCSNQKCFHVSLWEGNSTNMSFIADFDLECEKSVKQGCIAYHITFLIDANGLIDLYAIEYATQKETKLVVKSEVMNRSVSRRNAANQIDERRRTSNDQRTVRLNLSKEEKRLSAKKQLKEVIETINETIAEYENFGVDGIKFINTLGTAMEWLRGQEKSLEEYERKRTEIESHYDKLLKKMFDFNYK